MKPGEKYKHLFLKKKNYKTKESLSYEKSP